VPSVGDPFDRDHELALNGDDFLVISSRCVRALFLPYTIDNARVWKIDKEIVA
jgi:hypothetical protein